MKCEEYSNLIEDLVEGELDRQLTEEVNLHLFSCPKCTAQFEILRREKEMYAHYLFEVEPPVDLPAKFQHKLENVIQAEVSVTRPSLISFGWASQALAFLRFNPALTTAILLILTGLGLAFLNSSTPQQNLENIQANQIDNNNIQLALPVLPPKEATPRTPKDEMAENRPAPEIIKKEVEIKPVAVRQIVKKEQPKAKGSALDDGLSNEERLQIKEMQALEIETLKQMEKVELLLRSFRNIRNPESGEQYDVAYEKQQARKLLQNNIALRQKAENYGTMLTEEMLSRVEPYLLDIANLDSNPTPEKVSEIKARVRTQNIIASLQSF